MEKIIDTPISAKMHTNQYYEWAYIAESDGNLIAESIDVFVIGSGKWLTPQIEAMMTATNETYGKSINPEAIGDLLKSLEELREAFIKNNMFRSLDYQILARADAAIQKSKI